jgi:hypothetical protein
MLVGIGTAHATLHATSRLTTSSVIVPTMYDPRAVLNSMKSAERRPALQSEDRNGRPCQCQQVHHGWAWQLVPRPKRW